MLSLKITKVTGIKEKSDKRFLANHMFVTDDDEIAFSLFYRHARCTGPSLVPNRNNNDCMIVIVMIVTKWLEIQKTNLSLIIIYGQLSFPPKIFFTCYFVASCALKMVYLVH